MFFDAKTGRATGIDIKRSVCASFTVVSSLIASRVSMVYTGIDEFLCRCSVLTLLVELLHWYIRFWLCEDWQGHRVRHQAKLSHCPRHESLQKCFSDTIAASGFFSSATNGSFLLFL